MHIGHINLEKSMNEHGEHFVYLVERLSQHRVQQHVIARNLSLAKRLTVYEGVTVGPVTRTPVMAYVMMPHVDIVHAHDDLAGQAALLMALTRSIPYVITRRSLLPMGRNPVVKSVYARATGVIRTTDAIEPLPVPAAPQDIIEDIVHAGHEDFDLHANRVAAEHMRVYRRAADSSRVPAALL